jgi:hypothetical protein
MLYLHLQPIGANRVPRDVLDQLRDEFNQTAQRNMLMTLRLLKLLDHFAQNGIEAIPYKGPVLTSQAYGNVALRKIMDLDLFIRQENVPRAAELLVHQGFRAAGLTSAQMALHLKFHSELIFHHPQTGELVELHWKLTDEYFCFSPDAEKLWQRAEDQPFAGRTIRVFSAADQLLFLCVHGTQHCWNRLEWICGVSELNRSSPDIDFEAISAEARRLGSGRMFNLGLALAHDLLGRGLRDGILERIRRDVVIPRLVRQISRRLFDDGGAEISPLASYWFHMQARELPRHKIEYPLRLAVTPTLGDWEWVRLPPGLSPLYYPLRPLRLAAGGLRALGARLIPENFLGQGQGV